MVSTFSEVAVADITSTNIQEFWTGSLVLWSTSFIYILLFANVASLIANMQSEQMNTFIQDRNYILRKIKDSHVPTSVVSQANLYFDYKLSASKICS